MPALPYPTYSIQNLYLFPLYESVDDYKRAVGQDPPAWDSNRPPKFWFDPKAKDSVKRSVVYDPVLAIDDNGKAIVDAKGNIELDLLVLTKEEASTVNIPPLATNVPGATVPPVPCPMRPLEPNEELFFTFGGIISVKNTDLYDAQQSGFTPADRVLLKAIATKLGL